MVTGGYSNTTECLDLNPRLGSGAWIQSSKLKVGRAYGGLVVFDDNLVAVGGIRDEDGDGNFDSLTCTDTERIDLSTAQAGKAGRWRVEQAWGKFGICQAVTG